MQILHRFTATRPKIGKKCAPNEKLPTQKSDLIPALYKVTQSNAELLLFE